MKNLVFAIHSSSRARQAWCKLVEAIFCDFLEANSKVPWHGEDVEKLDYVEKVKVFEHRGYEIKEIAKNINYAMSGLKAMYLDNLADLYCEFSDILCQEKGIPLDAVRLEACCIPADGDKSASFGFVLYETLAVPRRR